MSQLRGQIAHQEKRNNNLFSSNATLRKLNSELTAQLEELTTSQAALVEKNVQLISHIDGMRDELVSEKAVSAGLKTELETTALKVQTIAVDTVLSARAELMGECKRGEHSTWDPDEEIRTWDKRAALVVKPLKMRMRKRRLQLRGAQSQRKQEWIPSRPSPMWGLRQLCLSLWRWLRALRILLETRL